MIAKIGMKVRVKECHLPILSPYGYSIGNEYTIVKTNHFWNSIRIPNDQGIEHTFDVDRFELIGLS